MIPIFKKYDSGENLYDVFFDLMKVESRQTLANMAVAKHQYIFHQSRKITLLKALWYLIFLFQTCSGDDPWPPGRTTDPQKPTKPTSFAKILIAASGIPAF